MFPDCSALTHTHSVLETGATAVAAKTLGTAVYDGAGFAFANAFLHIISHILHKLLSISVRSIHTFSYKFRSGSCNYRARASFVALPGYICTSYTYICAKK